MAKPISDSRMLKILKNEGVNVYGYRSWRSHNRGSRGTGWGPINGVMIHHTVSRHDDSSVALCYNGHATLPGPLCHAVGRNDGRVALVSNGRANHAGSGDPDVMRAVIAERSTPRANSASVDGNSRFYGIELVNMGDGRDTYTSKQYDQAVRWAAAICREYGWSAGSVIGHKEWQPGKIDPRGPVEGHGDFDMDRFRADVQRRLNGKASDGSNLEDEVTRDDMEKIADLVADRLLNADRIEVPWESDNKRNQVENALASMWRQTYRTEQKVEAVNAEVKALAEAIGSMDLAGFKSAVESLDVSFDVK